MQYKFNLYSLSCFQLCFLSCSWFYILISQTIKPRYRDENNRKKIHTYTHTILHSIGIQNMGEEWRKRNKTETNLRQNLLGWRDLGVFGFTRFTENHSGISVVTFLNSKNKASGKRTKNQIGISNARMSEYNKSIPSKFYRKRLLGCLS